MLINNGENLETIPIKNYKIKKFNFKTMVSTHFYLSEG